MLEGFEAEGMGGAPVLGSRLCHTVSLQGKKAPRELQPHWVRTSPTQDPGKLQAWLPCGYGPQEHLYE
jgi:hypothetical protein